MSHLKLKKKLVAFSIVAGVGSVFANNCINFAASLPICGAVLTFCTPSDQLNVLFPLLDTPDFTADPSCTIPQGCGVGVPGNLHGELPDQPTESQGDVGGTSGGGV